MQARLGDPMTEPHDITSVSRRHHMPQGESTLDDYQSSLRARFGKLPSWTELASRENAAMRRVNFTSTMARAVPSGGYKPTPKHKAHRREMRRTEGEATLAKIMSHLPNYTGAIADVGGLSRSHVATVLGMACKEGRVTKTFIKRNTLWEARV